MSNESLRTLAVRAELVITVKFCLLEKKGTVICFDVAFLEKRFVRIVP